jgi:hypothetical protein
VGALIIVLTAALGLAGLATSTLAAQDSATMTPSETPTPSPRPESSHAQTDVPQGILDPILTEAAKLAKVPVEQVVIVRAESALWNDGSLGCPEPGMVYTQAVVNGYWVVIKAAGKTYDFRVGPRGSFRLCPPGQGRPPSQPNNR